MYKLLRNFSIAALICFVSAIFALTWFHYEREVDEHRKIGELKNTAFLGVLQNSLSHLYIPLLTEVSQESASRSSTIAQLRREVERQLARTDIVALELHGSDGTILFSTEPASTEPYEGEDDAVLTALRGQTNHRWAADESLTALATDAKILETYHPVRLDVDDAPIGVLELYTDISPDIDELRREVTAHAAAEVTVLLLLYFVLLFIVLRADRVLRSQHQQRTRDLAELMAAKEAAEEGNRTKSRFLTNVSHELRTPMSTVIGSIDLLLHTRLDDGQRRHLQTISQSGTHLLRVVDDLLEVASMEAGKLTLLEVNFDVIEVVSTVLEWLRTEADSKKVDIAAELESETVLVCGDPGRLREVLINLIGNAIKFAVGGKVVVRIRTIAEDDESVVIRFTVQDNGIGIDPEHQEEIFEAFSQVDTSAARRYRGTGLGLTICRFLVERMGGQIGVESRRGHGATFWFTVRFKTQDLAQGSPADVPEEFKAHEVTAGEPAERSTSSSPLPLPSRQGGERRVLVAEDDELTRKVLVDMLDELDCVVSSVSNGRAVLSAVEKAPFDILLLDCHMPEMDGYQVARELRRGSPGSRPSAIVALSADTGHETRRRCFAAGMDDFLGKPLRLNDLAMKITRWLPAKARRGVSHTTAISVDDDTPMLCSRFREDLRQHGRDDRFPSDELVVMFVNDTEARLARITEHLELDRHEQVRREAHTLKGACRQLGFIDMAQHCQALQNSETLIDLRTAFDRLKGEFERARSRF